MPALKCSSYCVGKQAGAAASPGHFPHALLESAERAFRAGAAASTRPNQLQRAVACRLWELGVQHKTQHLTPDGLFCVDIALEDCKVRAMFDADPQS